MRVTALVNPLIWIDILLGPPNLEPYRYLTKLFVELPYAQAVDQTETLRP